ncbi:uncharacterized protein [Primulina eburnea]|uniref:uncharacterized protein n=1 Tax=Primulina eburnea TaxID=1245227 RepID=UPI003C6C5AEC
MDQAIRCRQNVEESENLLNDFQLARDALSTLPVNVKCLSPAMWMPPPEYKIRLDVDAAYTEESNSCSIGGVVRNHEGQPIVVFGRKIDMPQSVICAELLAILGGIKQAQMHNLEIHHIASDSLFSVQAVTTPEENLSYSGSIVTEIKLLLNSWNSTSLFHVRRSANMVAHSIAAFVISSNSQFVWEIGDFPVWLIHLVTKDLLALQ